MHRKNSLVEFQTEEEIVSSPALSLEATTIHIAEEIAVRASIDATFAGCSISSARTTRPKWTSQCR